MSKYYQYQTSQAELINKKTDAELAGYAKAMDAASAFNKELGTMSDTLFKLKGLIQGINSTALGGALGVAGGAVVGGISTLTGAAVLRKIMGGTAAKAAGSTVGKTALKVGTKGLGRGVPLIGGFIEGTTHQGLVKSVLTNSILAGTAVGVATGGVGAIPAALATAGLTAAGYLVGNLFGSTTSSLTTSNGEPSGNVSSQKKAWATQFLQGVGAPVTDANMQAITTWMNAEGGNWNNTAKYNPLNTTKSMPGAKTMQGSSAGVKAYASWNQGLQANVDTLKLSYYSDVRSALMQGNDTNAVLQAVQNSPWAAGHYGYNLASGGSSAATTTSSGNKTVNISLNIDKATHEEAVKLAKEVKRILQNDKDLNKIGSK